MADKYGSYYNNGSYNVFKAAIRYETTETTDTYVKIRCRSWCKMGDGHDSGANIQGQAYITNSYSSWVAGSGYLNAGDESGFLGDITKTIYKTENAQTITCSGQVWGSTWNAYSPWVNATIIVPALQSWSVTYNANGGSGAPASQTKYYGKALTLSSSTPTRSGYTFQGWATSASGSVAYKAGASYTGNAALSLYAIWKANATAPTITRLVAYRSTSGARDEESTTQVTFECTWAMDSGAASRSVQFKYKIDSGSETTKTVSSPAISGSTTQSYAVTLSATSRMTVTAVVTDSTHGLVANRVATIGPVFKPFHMANKGFRAAFFGLAGAVDRVLTIFGSLFLTDSAPALRFTSTALANKAGTDVPSSNVALASDLVYDKNNDLSFYSQLMRTDTDSLYKSFVVRRTLANGNAITHGFYIHIKADGTPDFGLTGSGSSRRWHKAISPWTAIASLPGGTTTASWTDLNTQGYTEILIACGYSTTYHSSIVIPVDQLSTTENWWYLGGGYWSNSWGAACKVTLTKIAVDPAKVNGSNVNASWKVYAR